MEAAGKRIRIMSPGFLLLQGGELIWMTVTLNTLCECDEYVISHGYSVPLPAMHKKIRKTVLSVSCVFPAVSATPLLVKLLPFIQ